MKGKHIRLLRERAKMSQAAMAEVLQVTQRTIANWESEENAIISKVYANICRTAFENLLLAPLLKHATQLVFEKLPAECIKIWLVRYSLFPMQYAGADAGRTPIQRFWEVILHENTARLQCLHKLPEEKDKCPWKDTFCEGDHCYHADRMHINMEEQLSLVTFPLRKGEIINLSGDEIEKHPYKGKIRPGRTNDLYHDQLCHSLLHVPYFIFGESAPQPVALLYIDNKLEKEWLKLTDSSFRKLANEELLADVLNSLKSLKDREFAEDTLLDAIERQIGKELSNQQKTLLLKHALKEWKVMPFPKGATGEAFSKEDEQTAKELIKEIYEEHLRDIVEAFDYLP